MVSTAAEVSCAHSLAEPPVAAVPCAYSFAEYSEDATALPVWVAHSFDEPSAGAVPPVSIAQLFADFDPD